MIGVLITNVAHYDSQIKLKKKNLFILGTNVIKLKMSCRPFLSVKLKGIGASTRLDSLDQLFLL